MNLEQLRSSLRPYARGRTVVIIGDELCTESERHWFENGVCKEIPISEVKDIEELYNTLRPIVKNLHPECVIPLCLNSAALELHRGALQLYTCLNGRLELSKHRLDTLLKCISIADSVIIIGLSKPLKPIVDIIPLALAMNRHVVVVSKSFRDFDGYSDRYVRIEI